jgi:hypothetical protein
LSSDLSRLIKEYRGNADKMLELTNSLRTVKIRRAGNAEAVTLPRKWLQILAWKEGDSLLLRLDKGRGTINLQKATIPGGSK